MNKNYTCKTLLIVTILIGFLLLSACSGEKYSSEALELMAGAYSDGRGGTAFTVDGSTISFSDEFCSHTLDGITAFSPEMAGTSQNFSISSIETTAIIEGNMLGFAGNMQIGDNSSSFLVDEQVLCFFSEERRAYMMFHRIE